MVKVIKTYEAKYGTIRVTEYSGEDTENGKEEYLVEHDGAKFKPAYTYAWYRWKTDAIAHAQFLAAKF